MPFTKLTVEQSLKNKGFQNVGGDHKYLVYFTLAGKQTDVKTKVSRGSQKDVDDGLISMMRKQCKLEKSEFLQLIECPLKQEMYEALLRNKGYCD